MVHRGAIPSRAEIAPVRAASAVRVVHRGGRGAVAPGIDEAASLVRATHSVVKQPRRFLKSSLRANGSRECILDVVPANAGTQPLMLVVDGIVASASRTMDIGG